MNEKKIITAADIRAALRRRYSQPEASIAFEVAKSTGSGANRHLDAVAMELWPSRGFALHGIEIKVSKSDWKREKENPATAEEIARFCDYFWVAAPKGMIPVDDVPLAWGLLEYDPDKGELKQAKPAKANEHVQPIGKPFLAAMLRASSRVMDPEDVDAVLLKRRKELEASYEQKLANAVEARRGRDKDDAENWRKLAELLTGEPDCWIYEANVINAVKVLMKIGPDNIGWWMTNAMKSAKNMHETISKAVEELGVEVPTEDETLKRHIGRR